MLSLRQAYDVKDSRLEYLNATFGFREQEVEQAFQQLDKNLTGVLFHIISLTSDKKIYFFGFISDL